MDLTDDILKVAISKSVEAGLLPRRALKEDFQDAKEMMRIILQCVFDKAGVESKGFTICVDPSSLENPQNVRNKSQVFQT